MTDSINVDKLVLRKQVTESLDRLQKQNYIARNGVIYQFLTDEEQDIAREINNQNIDAANVISQVCKTIFDDVYATKKYRYTKNGYNYDFEFDKSVDGQNHGNTTGGMKLKFVTEANDDVNNELKLITDSKGHEAICKLSDQYTIFADIENALKIDKYIKQKNVSQLPESVQTIITNKQKEARRLLNEAKGRITDAIINGKFYIDGDVSTIAGTSVKVVLDKALETLVDRTYSSITLIDTPANTDADIRDILNGNNIGLNGIEPNKQACDDVYRYLYALYEKKMPTSMNDIQSRYQGIPYGWKEIDIAAVVARLIQAQKVTIKHSGETIQPNDYRLVEFLRKRTEIGFTNVSIRESIPAQKIKTVRDILKDYFDVMDVPSDEDGLIAYITKEFKTEKYKLEDMTNQNNTFLHPGTQEIQNLLGYVNKILSAQSDNLTLVNTLCDLEDDLLDSKDDIRAVENFYDTQIKLFDNAIDIRNEIINHEEDYLLDNEDIKKAIEKINDITRIITPFKYNRIPELNDCISIINDQRNKVIQAKKHELNDLIKSY